MSVRGKTVADAIELFEDLAKDLREHKDEFKLHVKEQRGFNEAITARVVEAEKADITIGAKLDTVLERMNRITIGWQVWVPVAMTLIISVITLVIQVWPKGVAS